MIVTGNLLFTIDGSGAWNTQSLFDLATGARVSSADWRNSSRSMVWSAVQSEVLFLDSGVSPTDVQRVSIDLANRQLGAEVDSPYHGDYSLPNPLKLWPGESQVVVGSGLIFKTTDLTYVGSLGLVFADLAFLDGRLYLLSASGASSQVTVLDASSNILGAAYWSGSPISLWAFGNQLVLVTATGGGAQIRLVDPTSLQ